MIVGFTGTQHGMTWLQWHKLSQMLIEFNVAELHHGDCVGADHDAHRIATVNPTLIHIHVHPPSNPTKRAFSEIRPQIDTRHRERPYITRNRDIVDATEALIATPAEPTEQTRSGTWSTIRYARKRGKPVYIINPDGSVEGTPT